jgi:hypothetical protein
VNTTAPSTWLHAAKGKCDRSVVRLMRAVYEAGNADGCPKKGRQSQREIALNKVHDFNLKFRRTRQDSARTQCSAETRE